MKQNLPKQYELTLSATERRLVLYNHITYGLYIISFFTAGLLFVVPIILNYLFRPGARGTWLESHFSWQIHTFWFSIIIALIGGFFILLSFGGYGFAFFAELAHKLVGISTLLLFLGIGIVVFAIAWHLYRIVRGWIALADRRSVP